jgi:hypothetical protein
MLPIYPETTRAELTVKVGKRPIRKERVAEGKRPRGDSHKEHEDTKEKGVLTGFTGLTGFISVDENWFLPVI